MRGTQICVSVSLTNSYGSNIDKKYFNWYNISNRCSDTEIPAVAGYNNKTDYFQLSWNMSQQPFSLAVKSVIRSIKYNIYIKSIKILTCR